MKDLRRILGISALLGLVGPFPGYLIYTFHGSADMLFGGWKYPQYTIGWYLIGAVPIMGPFCFIASFLGLIVVRIAQESPRSWLAPMLLVILPLVAAVPISLLGIPEFAIPSSIFWSAVLFGARKRLFNPKPSPESRAAYLWLTEFK